MSERIKVLALPAIGAPEIREVPNELRALQEIVGGYIETVPYMEGHIVVCNEEGVLLGLPGNRYVPYLVGDVFVCGVEGEDFTSISEELEEAWPILYGRGDG